MESDILNFIEKNGLNPFNLEKTSIGTGINSIYKTRDAKAIHTKMLNKISSNFVFKDTQNILQFFDFTNDKKEIEKRKEFFSSIKKKEISSNLFLDNLSKPKNKWKPEYDVVVVTEDTDTYNELKKRNCPVQMIVSEMDVSLLESRDIVQIIDCEEYGAVLESLPQSVFLKNIDEVYLERHLEEFSGWVENFNWLNLNNSNEKIKEIVGELLPIIKLIQDSKKEVLDRDDIENRVIEANYKISEKIKNLTLSGTTLMEIISKSVLPDEIKKILEETIVEFEIPREILNIKIPLEVDEEEFEKVLDEENKNEFSNLAERIKDESFIVKQIPRKLKELSKQLILFDFYSGVKKFMKEEYEFILIGDEMKINNSKNFLISSPEPISFDLSNDIKCSILTGANSGGKTTLVEHVIQLITLSQLGIAASGKISMPLFEEVYYFAKNKGSNLKGAFETLLDQMSKIKPGNKTLILADEIEAVTEPGVAGNIIAATAQYYLNKGCFLIVATHLGHEIVKILPKGARVDGIEATGLDKDFNLIVNHNPVLGRLAHSTPELIVEKMANVSGGEYFRYLDGFLKGGK